MIMCNKGLRSTKADGEGGREMGRWSSADMIHVILTLSLSFPALPLLTQVARSALLARSLKRVSSMNELRVNSMQFQAIER